MLKYLKSLRYRNIFPTMPVNIELWKLKEFYSFVGVDPDAKRYFVCKITDCWLSKTDVRNDIVEVAGRN